MPNPNQVAADASAAYAAGYSQMLQHLAEQEAGNQQSFLELIGAPQSQIDQYMGSAQFPADVLYGAYGEIPGTSLAQQGAAFDTAAGNMPGIFGSQLAYNQNVHAQQMAQERALASLQNASYSGGGGGGGSDGGLTANQAFDNELALRKFQYEMAQDQSASDLEWAKFQYDMDKDQAEAESNAMMWALAADALGIDLPKGALAGLTSTSGLSSILGLVGGRQDDERDAAADAAGRRRERREDLRGMISFDGINDGLSKAEVVSTIMSSIRAQFPKFAGLGEARVRNEVRSYVNDNWANYRAGRDTSSPGGGGGFARQWDRFEAGSAMRRGLRDYMSSLRPESSNSLGESTPAQRPAYRTAFARTMAAVRAEWGGKWNMRVKKQVAARVHRYLRAQGLRRPPRRRPPRRPPHHAITYPGRN